MTFRVTPHRQLELQIRHSQTQTSQSGRLQNQISSGVRIHRPSDDPRAQQTILNQQASIKRLETQLGSIEHARTYLNQSNVQLLDANSLVVQAKSLALQARQGIDSFEFEAVAIEIDGFLETFDSIANSQFDGRYLFGGVDHGAPPYTNVQDGPTTYTGSAHTGFVVLPDEDALAVFLDGDDVFTFTTTETGAQTDVFSVIRNLRDELRNAGNVTPTEFGDKIDNIVAELEQASEHLLNTVGEQSVSLQQLDRIQERTEDLQFQAQQLLSDTESTDSAAAIIELQEEQNLLQLTLASTARLFEISVLDYLR